MPAKDGARPVCRKCGAAHFNFQPCAAAIGKTEKPGPPVEFKPFNDWYAKDVKGVLGFGSGVAWRDDDKAA